MKKEFVPPAFEPNVKQGIPVVPSELGYSSLSQEGMTYGLHICGVCSPDSEGSLLVYFTNDEGNDVMLRLAVYKGEQLLTETGLVRAGEYVESVKVDPAQVRVGDKVSYKVKSYRSDYTSAGNVVLNTVVSEYEELSS